MSKLLAALIAGLFAVSAFAADGGNANAADMPAREIQMKKLDKMNMEMAKMHKQMAMDMEKMHSMEMKMEKMKMEMEKLKKELEGGSK